MDAAQVSRPGRNGQAGKRWTACWLGAKQLRLAPPLPTSKSNLPTRTLPAIAIRLTAPGDVWARGLLGIVSAFSSEEVSGLVSFEAALGLSPLKFDWLLFHQAHAQLWTGDLARAMEGAEAYRSAVPGDSWGIFLIALIHAFSGRPEAAQRAVAELAVSGAPIRIADVRRSQRHRDPARLERVVAAMRAAGMPD